MHVLLEFPAKPSRVFGLSPINFFEYWPENEEPDTLPINLTEYLLPPSAEAGSSQDASNLWLLTAIFV